jgi:T-complex protein 1 subunit zeta
MQIQHPTAGMVARAATAQDDIVGDGTTSNVLLIGEMMKLAQRLIQESVHPKIIVEGLELARKEALVFLETFKVKVDIDKPLLLSVARTALNTKLIPNLANMMVEMVVDAVQVIQRPDAPIDLHMVEIMHMIHKDASESRLIRGIVMDHGARHASMPKRLEDVYILACNVSLEYEKTEINSQFFFSNAEERQKLANSERKFTDDRCQKVIDFKRRVCKDGRSFAIFNEKGIDPICLEQLAKEDIIALRRTKRRNMERITLACGGRAVNSFEDLTESDLGHAKEVYEQVLGEDKYTFIEGVDNPKSCTLLLKGPNDHTIAQLKDAVRDGLRAVKNTIDDKCVVPGAGAFEVACSHHLYEFAKSVKGKVKLGVQCFAEALLVIPKVLAENSGYDIQEAMLMLKDEYEASKKPVGLDVTEYRVLSPVAAAVFDNYCCKKQFLHVAPTLAEQLLLVDEIMRAGRTMGGGPGEE